MARMPVIQVENYSFAYPAPEGPAGSPRLAADAAPAGRAPGAGPGRALLAQVSLAVEEGAFCVVAGPTGCGKTTLLRSLKPELMPVGEKRGRVSVLGRPLVADGAEQLVDARFSATHIGYVMQDPAAQIVTDTVWHELAFGLENLGMVQGEMRRRVAEVAHFFGIEPWMHAATETLSGGQKQLVNLAGVLALRPRLLLLDEPTAQLDPNARRQFAMLLGRVNRELGLTVVMATHAPEDVADLVTQRVDLGAGAPAAERAAVEERLLRPQWRRWEQVCARADGAGRGHGARGASGAGSAAAGGFSASLARRPRLPRGGADPAPGQYALIARDAYFRYGRTAPWVLRGLDVAVRAGSVHAFVGGNGCGKSTLLRVLAGISRPQRGVVESALRSRQALLPQDPKALLVCDTVADELAEWRARCGYAPKDERAMLERFGLGACAAQHPYDLSGGQQQKLALAKVLLADPRLLLLDEPTKGLDPRAAAGVARQLRALAAEGRTVVVVTHDLDFAFCCADEVSLVFDGELACTDPAEAFFAGNLIWRPSRASRLFGALLDGEGA